MSIFLLQTEPPGSLGSDMSPHVQSLIELRAMMAPRHSETASSSVIATKLVVCILVALLLKYLVYESSIYCSYECSTFRPFAKNRYSNRARNICACAIGSTRNILHYYVYTRFSSVHW